MSDNRYPPLKANVMADSGVEFTEETLRKGFEAFEALARETPAPVVVAIDAEKKAVTYLPAADEAPRDSLQWVDGFKASMKLSWIPAKMPPWWRRLTWWRYWARRGVCWLRLRLQRPWEPPEGIDPECVKLCRALNRLPGIRTTESCCGHDRNDHPFWIWVRARNLNALRPIAYYLKTCHCGFAGWRLEVTTDCAMKPVDFLIEGPCGAFAEADEIAELIDEYVEGEDDPRVPWYDLLKEWFQDRFGRG